MVVWVTFVNDRAPESLRTDRSLLHFDQHVALSQAVSQLRTKAGRAKDPVFSPAFSPVETAQGAVIQTSSSAPANLDSTVQFDGHELCNSLVDVLAANHRRLLDSRARSEYVARWSPVCKSDQRLDSEAGADQLGREMLASLGEPFDHYYDPADLASEDSDSKGIEIGRGIETGIVGAASMRDPQPYAARISDEHPLVVRTVAERSPAARAGIEPGDRILAVNGGSVDGMKRRDVADTYSDNLGVQVKLKISHAELGQQPVERTVTLTTQQLDDNTVSYSDLGDGIGRIRLKNFVNERANAEMIAALRCASSDKAVVIDLRNNGGGHFTLMKHIAEDLLDEGVLYKLESREGDHQEVEELSLTHTSLIRKTIENNQPDVLESPRPFWRILPKNVPIVLLVDEYTASVSEVLVGLLKENGVATVVGQPTTGKTAGQLEKDLPFGRMVAATNFEWYPAGKPTRKGGIDPDVIVEDGRTATSDPQLARSKQEAIKLASKYTGLTSQ
jgi:carboxyl-terminal processing protease